MGLKSWVLLIGIIVAILAFAYWSESGRETEGFDVNKVISDELPELGKKFSEEIPKAEKLIKENFVEKEMNSGINEEKNSTETEVQEPKVYFCPEDACAEKIIEGINSAEKKLHVAVYSFTLDSISKVLIEAAAREVEVKVIFDIGQAKSKYSEDEKLAEAGIEVRYAGFEGYMHNKFVVYDEDKVSTGSFNFSKNANENNDENLIFLYGEKIASEFESEFEELWNEAR